MLYRLQLFPILSLLLAIACGNGSGVDHRDRKAPSILSIVPADGALDVAVRSEITVVYDEALRTQNFDMNAFLVVDPKGVPADGFLALNNDQLVFRASKPFEFNTVYTIKLSNSIQDLFGNRAEAFQSTFTTVADREPPSAPYNLVYNPLSRLKTAAISGAKEPDTTLEINGKKVSVSVHEVFFDLSLALETEGANTFSMVAIDKSGNRSEPNTFTIVRDMTPPAGLTACAGPGLAWQYQGRTGCWIPPDPLYWNNVQLTVGNPWSPANGDIAFINLGDDQHTFGKASFEVDLLEGGAPSGPVSLTIGTRDLAGNETIAIQRTFVYDDSPPTLYLSGAAVAAVTNVTTGQLTFLKGDDRSPSQVDYFATVDSAPTNACAASASSCTLVYGPLAPGIHRFSVSATDAAGNTTRILKTLTVDTIAPSAVVVPIAGATTGLSPTLHVFAQEPVTASILTLNGTLTFPGTVEPGTARKHWAFATSSLVAGAQTASVSLRDAAGNTTDVTWSFMASADAVTLPATYAGLITKGPRDGHFTLYGMPAGGVNVVRFEKNNLGTVELYATSATLVSAEAEPLSMLIGSVDTYNADGVSTSTALPITVWNDSTPQFQGTFFASAVVPFPVYSSAISFSGATSGFTLFSDSGYRFRVDDAGLADTHNDNLNCSIPIRYPTYPLLKQSETLALAGMECLGSPQPNVYQLSLIDFSRSVLWTGPAEDIQFGTALASGDLVGDGSQTILVGSPAGPSNHGSVYVYANSAATAPVLQLRGNPNVNNNQFGGSIAVANNHLPGTGALAAIAYNEAAVYFYDGKSLQAELTSSNGHPMATYRARHVLPTTQPCPVSTKNRQEVIAPGDLDGDGSGDFVTASWSDDCPLTTYPYLEYQVSIQIFLGGPGASDADPIVIDQRVSKRNTASRPRLMALGDLNDDGRADFGYIDVPQAGLIRVFYGDPSGTPNQTLLRPFADDTAISWALGGVMDGNGDGYPDFILSRYDQAQNLKQMLWP